MTEDKKKNPLESACLLMHVQLLSHVRLFVTLVDPPGSSVRGLFQTRILEWVAIFSSRGSPDPGIEATSPALKADSLALSHLGSLCLLIHVH